MRPRIADGMTMPQASTPSPQHTSDTPEPSPPLAAPTPLLRRAVRGRRLPENLRTVIRLDRRTLMGREATAFRAAMLRHCGSDPSEPQKATIELATQMRMRLLAMDARFAERGEQSAHDARQYLAWSNGLRRALQALGMQAAPTPRSPGQTLNDVVAGIVAARGRKDEPA